MPKAERGDREPLRRRAPLYSQALHTTQLFGTLFDGITRHTREGYAFQERATAEGFKAAVRARDEPYGDARPR